MPRRDDAEPIRVRLVDGGPILVPGPVEMELADGTSVRSERPVVAICACRRSRRYPFCDTSHRRRSRPPSGPAGAERPCDQDESS